MLLPTLILGQRNHDDPAYICGWNHSWVKLIDHKLPQHPMTYDLL